MHGNQQVPPAILRMQPGVSNGTAARPTLPLSTHPSLRQPLPVCRVKDGRCGWRRSREQILKKEPSSFPTDLWTEHVGFQIGLKPPRSNCVPAPSNQFQTTTCLSSFFFPMPPPTHRPKATIWRSPSSTSDSAEWLHFKRVLQRRLCATAFREYERLRDQRNYSAPRWFSLMGKA